MIMKLKAWSVKDSVAVGCVLASLVLSACSMTPREVRDVDVRAARPARPCEKVELLSGKPEKSYREIAVVESFRSKRLDAEITRRMMEDLQAKGAAVGADAVIGVKRLADRHEGFVSNPRTPFPSVMQGEWKTYFFRGTAIRYTNR